MTRNEIRYETKELGPASCTTEEKKEIDNVILNDDFFSELDLDDESVGFHNMDDESNNDDNLIAQHVDYFENYTMKLLYHIANYYNIPKTKIKKDAIISLIVDYENNPENSLQVYNRKRCWCYIQELQQDCYFGKFIVFE